jgi:hypothetical protein
VYALGLVHDWLDVDIREAPLSSSWRGFRALVADRLLPEASRPQPKSARDNLGGLLFTSMLCDRLTSSAWMLWHHAFRAGRRRLKTAAPHYLPDHWSA